MTDLAHGYVFSADPALMDRARIHRWMSEEAYWARGRSRETQDAAIDGSRSYGIFRDGEQVAYARVVTDGVTFAWLCDVFVDPSVRGLGLGSALVDAVNADLDARGVGRTVLVTSSAHGLYEQHGYAVMEQPQHWMVRFRPN